MGKEYSVNRYPELNAGIKVDTALYFDLVTPGKLVDVPASMCSVVIPLYTYPKPGEKVLSDVQIEPHAGNVGEYSILPKFLEAGLRMLIVPSADVEERGKIWEFLDKRFKKYGVYGLADPKAAGHMRVMIGKEETWNKCGIKIRQFGSKALKIWKLFTPPSRAVMYSTSGINKHLRIGLLPKLTKKFMLNGVEQEVPTHDGPIYGRVSIQVRKKCDDGNRRMIELTECQIRLPFHGQGKGLYVCAPAQFKELCEMGGFDPSHVHMVCTMDAIKGPGYAAGDIIHMDLDDRDAFRLLKFKESQGRSSVSNQAVVYRDWDKIRSLLVEKLDDQRNEFGQTITDFIHDVLSNRDAEALEFLTLGIGSSETAIEDNTSHVIKNLCWSMWRDSNSRWEFPSYSSNWTRILALMYSVYKDRCLKVRVGDQNFYVAYDTNLTGNQISMPVQNSFTTDLAARLEGKYLNASRAPFVSTYSISDANPFKEDGSIRVNPTKYTIFCAPEFFTGFWMDGDGDLMMLWISKTSFPFVQMPAPEDVKVYAKADSDLNDSISDQMASSVQAATRTGILDMCCRYCTLIRKVVGVPVSDEESGWMGFVREVLTIKATKHHRGTSDVSYDELVISKILEGFEDRYTREGGTKLPFVDDQHLLHALARKDAGIRIKTNWGIGKRAPMDSECMNGIPSRIRHARNDAHYGAWPWSVVLDKLGDVSHLRPKHSDSRIIQMFFQSKWDNAWKVLPNKADSRDIMILATTVANQIISYYKTADKASSQLATIQRSGRFSIFLPYDQRKANVDAAVADRTLLIDKVSGQHEDIEMLCDGRISRSSKARRYTLIREWVEGKYNRTYAYVKEHKGEEYADTWLRVLGWRLGCLTFGTTHNETVSLPGSEYWYMPDTNLIKDAVEFSEMRMADPRINSPMNPWAEKYSNPKELEKLLALQEERNAKKLAMRANEQDSDDESTTDQD